MPRTRVDLDRQHKVEEIVAVAQRQLLAGGYAGLSMAGIARELGLAQNAIYWYFPSRDHLFVAAFRALLMGVAAKKPPASRGLIEQAVWIVDRLAEVHPLIVTIHERARTSEVVADFERELQSILRTMLSHGLAPHLPEPDVELATEAFMATAEGALLRGLPTRRRQALLRFTLERLTGLTADQRS